MLEEIYVDYIEIYDTCKSIVDEFFEYWDLDSFEGKLKPFERNRLFYCKENRCLYVIFDSENLNCIYKDVGYGSMDINSRLIISEVNNKLYHRVGLISKVVNSVSFRYNGKDIKIVIGGEIK